MDALRQCRRFGRLLAAWLLLWFCAMALPVRASVPAPVVVEPICGGEAHHNAGAAKNAGAHPGHGEHDASSSQHCPLCLHAAAPPLALLTANLGAAAPEEKPPAAVESPLRVGTDTPPPARGPPAFS